MLEFMCDRGYQKRGRLELAIEDRQRPPSKGNTTSGNVCRSAFFTPPKDFNKLGPSYEFNKKQRKL